MFISIFSREIYPKIIAIWWPTSAFVALALNHVTANKYFIAVAIIFYEHPDIGIGLYIRNPLIPTLEGNTVDGGLYVGAIYWYLYLSDVGPHDIKFDLGGLDTGHGSWWADGQFSREICPQLANRK